MAEKVHRGILLEHRVEPFEAVVVHLELPVHQHRHTVRLRQLVDLLHRRRVAFDAELLLGNDHAAPLQVALDLLSWRRRYPALRWRRTGTLLRARAN